MILKSFICFLLQLSRREITKMWKMRHNNISELNFIFAVTKIGNGDQIFNDIGKISRMPAN